MLFQNIVSSFDVEKSFQTKPTALGNFPARKFSATSAGTTGMIADANKTVAEQLSHLSASCAESAECLAKHRAIYEANGVFAPELINGLIDKLSSFKDNHLRQELKDQPDKMEELVKKYINAG